MEVRDYQPGDEFSILKLFKTTFNKEMSIELWNWRFSLNPDGKYKIKLMWEKTTLIGHYAVSPVKILIGNETHISALSMTTMTHPDYNGRGIFATLANQLYTDLETRDKCVAVWGFPNINSHYGFIKNLGWSNISQVMHLTLDSRKIVGKQSINVCKYDFFTNDQVNFLKEIYNGFPVALSISHEYLTWRYFENPSEKYYIFGMKNSNPSAFIVLKQYPSDLQTSIQNIYITEVGLTFETFHCFPELLEHVMSYFKQPLATINLWINLFDPRYILFEKLGFIPGGKPTYFGIRAIKQIKPIVTDYRNWHISYGYSDVY